MKSRDIAYHIRRKWKPLQSEKAKKGSKKPKVDWKWNQSDGAGVGFKAITRDVTTMENLTFKQYLAELAYRPGNYIAVLRDNSQLVGGPSLKREDAISDAKDSGYTATQFTIYQQRDMPMDWLKKHGINETVGGMYLSNTSFAAPNMPPNDENWDEDWSDDITDDGTSTGICPKCKSPASYTMTGKTLADARAFWECENEDCGHTGPKEGY